MLSQRCQQCGWWSRLCPAVGSQETAGTSCVQYRIVPACPHTDQLCCQNLDKNIHNKKSLTGPKKPVNNQCSFYFCYLAKLILKSNGVPFPMAYNFFLSIFQIFPDFWNEWEIKTSLAVMSANMILVIKVSQALLIKADNNLWGFLECFC